MAHLPRESSQLIEILAEMVLSALAWERKHGVPPSDSERRRYKLTYRGRPIHCDSANGDHREEEEEW